MKINLRSIFIKPTTAQEATERSNAAKLLALGCLAIAIILTVLGGLTQVDLFESLGMIAIVAAVVFFYLWYRFKGAIHKLQNIYCQCGERFVFPDHVSYEIKGEQVSSGRDSDGKGATAHTSTTVTLCCKCHKCGKVHTFDSVFITRRVRSTEHGTSVKEYPLPEQLTEFFNK